MRAVSAAGKYRKIAGQSLLSAKHLDTGLGAPGVLRAVLGSSASRA